jgi:hypothetical protein
VSAIILGLYDVAKSLDDTASHGKKVFIVAPSNKRAEIITHEIEELIKNGFIHSD